MADVVLCTRIINIAGDKYAMRSLKWHFRGDGLGLGETEGSMWVVETGRVWCPVYTFRSLPCPRGSGLWAQSHERHHQTPRHDSIIRIVWRHLLNRPSISPNGRHASIRELAIDPGEGDNLFVQRYLVEAQRKERTRGAFLGEGESGRGLH